MIKWQPRHSCYFVTIIKETDETRNPLEFMRGQRETQSKTVPQPLEKREHQYFEWKFQSCVSQISGLFIRPCRFTATNRRGQIEIISQNDDQISYHRTSFQIQKATLMLLCNIIMGLMKTQFQKWFLNPVNRGSTNISN